MSELEPLRILSPLHKASRQVEIFLAQQIKPLDVSTVEAHLLAYCHGYGPCLISELHRVFGYKRSTLTSILDRLEERRLIARKSNPQDRRSLLVAITPAGRLLALEVRRILEEFEAGLLDELGEREVRGFVAVLAGIAEATGVSLRR